MPEPSPQLVLPLFDAEPVEPVPQRPTSGVDSSRRQLRRDAPPVSDQAEAHALMTTHEVAVLLRVHPRTVQRLVERGELQAVHLGAAVRFDPADVRALTDRLKRRAPGVAPPVAGRVAAG